MVAAAFGDVQVADVLWAAMMAARMVARLTGPRPVVRLDSPVLADHPGYVLRGVVGAGELVDLPHGRPGTRRAP
jgi:hypothetical protein